MGQFRLVDKTSFVIALLFFIFSFFLFYSDTGMMWYSVLAAVIAAGLVWGTYIMLRLCILAFRR